MIALLGGASVLVVDDDRDSCEILKYLLGEAGGVGGCPRRAYEYDRRNYPPDQRAANKSRRTSIFSDD
jgi:hypothetical protein